MPPPRLTRVEWLVCIVAGLGFAFDLYESLMTPLIAGPALVSLGHMTPGSADFNLWVGLFFFVPMATGGVFGFWGGYLTDWFGRRRVLVWSILLYSISAAAASMATSLTMLLLLRCATLIGICVEAVAAVAWIAELFPDPKRRESILAYTQACYPLGGVSVSGAYFLAVTYGHLFPEIQGTHDAWRYTLLSGLIPAFPLMVLRPFVPESKVWEVKRGGAMPKRPSLGELFRPDLRWRSVVITIATGATLALSFGALQHTPRIVPGIVAQSTASPQQVQQMVSAVFFLQETGSIVGRFAFAAIVIRIASRRKLLRVFLAPAFLVFAWLFYLAPGEGLIAFAIGVFLAQAIFNGLHSFWGNYLPRMFPTHLRGTGESMAMNIGGRVLAVSAALLTTQMANVTPGNGPAMKLASAAGTTAMLMLIVVTLLSASLAEPAGEQLPD